MKTASPTIRYTRWTRRSVFYGSWPALDHSRFAPFRFAAHTVHAPPCNQPAVCRPRAGRDDHGLRRRPRRQGSCGHEARGRRAGQRRAHRTGAGADAGDGDGAASRHRRSRQCDHARGIHERQDARAEAVLHRLLGRRHRERQHHRAVWCNHQLECCAFPVGRCAGAAGFGGARQHAWGASRQRAHNAASASDRRPRRHRADAVVCDQSRLWQGARRAGEGEDRAAGSRQGRGLFRRPFLRAAAGRHLCHRAAALH